MIRKTIKATIRKLLKPVTTVLALRLDDKLWPISEQLALLSKRLDMLDSNRRVSQHVLCEHYQLLRKLNLPLPRLRDTGFRVYSQGDEDGLLLYVFSLIGMTNKVCVDIASGTPDGANTTNLIRNWGFTGFLIEGNEDKLLEASRFFAGPDTNLYPPKLKQAMVNAENVNDLLRELQVPREIDLFSLDIDGIDYWVWKSLNIIEPRVVICEFTPYWGPEKSLTIPYSPEFTRPHPNYWGASLAAFIKLGHQKGYRLVGCNHYGYNAIFVRRGLGEDVLPEVSPHECLSSLAANQLREMRFHDFPDVNKYPWVEV